MTVSVQYILFDLISDSYLLVFLSLKFKLRTTKFVFKTPLNSELKVLIQNFIKLIIYIFSKIQFLTVTDSRRSHIKVILKQMPKVTGKLILMYQNSFVIKDAKIRNKLLYNLTIINNFNLFKRKLDDYLKLYPDPC